jgi:hypothetical protein
VSVSLRVVDAAVRSAIPGADEAIDAPVPPAPDGGPAR